MARLAEPKRNERVLVALMADLVAFHALLLLADVAPDFVELDAAGADADHHAVMQFGAAATNAQSEARDRLAIGVGEARDGALADALTEGGNDFDLLRADPGSWDSGSMSWPGQAFEHDADHGETDEGRDGSRIALEVAAEAAVAADPSEGPLDDPSLGQDDETMQLVALDDLDFPAAGLGDGRGGIGPW